MLFYIPRYNEDPWVVSPSDKPSTLPISASMVTSATLLSTV